MCGVSLFSELVVVSVFMEPGNVFNMEMLTFHRYALEVCNFATIGQERELLHVFSTFLVKLLLLRSVLSNRNISGSTCVILKFLLATST